MSVSEIPLEVRKTLYEAVTQGQLDAIRAVHRQHPEALQQGWSGGDSPSYLHLAARKNQLAVCRLLIELGIPVDKTSDGETPLSEAAQGDHMALMQFLLGAGAAVDGPADAGSTPLIGAAINGQLEVVQALVAAGADIHRESLYLPQTALDFALAYAVKGGRQAEVAEFLRARGAIRPYLEKHSWFGVPQQLYIEHVERAVQGFVNPRPVATIERPGAKSIVLRRVRIPSSKYDFQIVFSAGFDPGRRELALILPSAWPLHEASLRLPRYAAPLEALAALLRESDPVFDASLQPGGLLALDRLSARSSGSPEAPCLASLAAAFETEREGDDRIARTLFVVPFKPRKAAKKFVEEAAHRAEQLMPKKWKYFLFASLPVAAGR